MSLTVGARLGVYEVLGTLGAGGMGEVYRARDTRLHRDVALKILPENVAHDADRLGRFEREARVLASLNHPNIAQIFGFEESSSVKALVMELVPGRTLDAMMARAVPAGALPLDQALSIARQIADALEAAHEAGVVHRDLKPANVIVRDDGVVKVLDFGLAKAAGVDLGGETSAASLGIDSPTMTSAAVTLAGSVLGTAAYMSPEQARGRAVDKRTDIWAFGVILFEMLTGRRLFEGETASDSIAAVLTREVDVGTLPPAVPLHVRFLLERCIERDPKRRLRDIGEARHQLEHGSNPPASVPRSASHAAAPLTPGVPPRRRTYLWAGAAVSIILLAALPLVWQYRQPPSAEPPSAVAQAPSSQSIVVLPFVNQSGTDDEYFSDGMTDELASALMKVPGLRVAARSSAFTFKGKNADARDVGAKLRVASVLEGTVRRAGSKLRVTAQLVNAADGLALWSERYEREANDVFKVQDDITGAIVSALRLTLGTNAGAFDHAGRTENADAHDFYLRGRFLMLKQTEDGLRKSLDYFAQALEKDPNYAPAYAGMAFAWSWLADAYLPPTEAEPKAKAAALKALALDPTNAEARTMIAIITWFYDLDVRTAEEEFRRVIASSPNSMDAHYLYALTLCSWKRFDQGLAETARAIALDPLSPVPSWTRATCLWRAHRYDDAIEQDRKTSELDPNFYYFESPAGLSYREKGMYAESVREYQHIQQVTGSPVSGLAVTYARMGRTSEARDILQQFLALAKHRYVSPEQVAVIYASLGEKNEAFAWLERAYEARSAFLAVGILTSPAYDPLRNDPRFSALLKKMNIESLAADR